MGDVAASESRVQRAGRREVRSALFKPAPTHVVNAYDSTWRMSCASVHIERIPGRRTMRRAIKALWVGLWFLAAGAACMGPEGTENPEVATVALSLPGGTVATIDVIPGKTQGHVSSVEGGQACEVGVSTDGKNAVTLAASTVTEGEDSSPRGGSEDSACPGLDATVLPAGSDATGNDKVAAAGGCCIRCGGFWACGSVACCGSICCIPN
jgi:hypothetical protein